MLHKFNFSKVKLNIAFKGACHKKKKARKEIKISYASTFGSLIYVLISIRPEITYAVGWLEDTSPIQDKRIGHL